jgi:hypothetical protein
MYKSPGIDEILAELIQAGSEILLSTIHKLNNSVWNNEELPDQWKESIIMPVHKKGDKTECNNYRGISLLSTSYKIALNFIEFLPLKVSSVNRWYYWGSSLWVSMLQFNYWSYFQQSSDTGENVGVQRDSISAIHRLQANLWLSEEGSIVRYSHRVWGTNETS